MEPYEIEACVQWFRQGLNDKLSHDDEETYRFADGTPPGLVWSYEAGLKVGKQMLCEKTGHDDEVREWHLSDGANKKYGHYQDRECQLCGREKTIAIAEFDSLDQQREYDLDRWKKARAEKAK